MIDSDLAKKQSQETHVTLSQTELPEDKVDADHSLGLRGPAVVEDSGLSLSPDKSSILSQKPVLAGAHLALGEHCKYRGKDQEEFSHFFHSIKENIKTTLLWILSRNFQQIKLTGCGVETECIVKRYHRKE